jgi:hypothetical protein
MLRRSGGALAARRRYCPFLLRSVDRDRYGKPDHAIHTGLRTPDTM